jgi:hypothetical protein
MTRSILAESNPAAQKGVSLTAQRDPKSSPDFSLLTDLLIWSALITRYVLSARDLRSIAPLELAYPFGLSTRETHAEARKPLPVGSCKLRVFSIQLQPLMAVTHFDYVIVGAGTAGCVLANRLSADGRSNVLLLEAGPRDTHFWIHVPLGYGKLFARTDVNWAYESEAEPNLNGRRIFTPRGKVLGGSSSINGLVHIRGQREDYDMWGVPGWTFDDLLPYFKKSENHQHGANDWRGAGGPICVSDIPDKHELCDAFIASAIELGIPRNDDFNGATQEGTGYYQAASRNGRRCSSAVGYLRPAQGRKNLRIEVEALATKVLFEGNRASGVVYEQRGERHEARAAREVILAGGTINTPQLLQLSGVGPRALLERHGDRGGARCAWRRRRSAGSLLLPHVLALHAAHYAQRRHAERVAQGQDRFAIPALAARPAHRECGICGRLCAHAA